MRQAVATKARLQAVRRREPERAYSTAELTKIILHACLVARDSVFNVGSLLSSSSGMAVLAVKECEHDLDSYEHLIDEEIPAAITHVDEEQARQLLSCLKFITDLERIGDLMLWVAQCARRFHPKLDRRDTAPLLKMGLTLEQMLDTTHTAFVSRDAVLAQSVIKADRQIDEVRQAMFRKYLQQTVRHNPSRTTNLLLMVQAFERAGDHAKNLGEELVHLFEGHSLRHVPTDDRRRGQNLSEL